MCGIVGYVGRGNASEIILEGLGKLEYRGYDSAGIAVLHDGKLWIKRTVGKLRNLVRALEDEPIAGSLGIGHTRWATHGKPLERNAHPHIDCKGRIAVVHNGIIENYADLKSRLKGEGHEFRSDTDTEVIAHLVEKYLDSGEDFEGAVRRALRDLRGFFAVCVVSALDPDRIVCAREGSAGGIVVGLGDGEMFIASDIPALVSHTRRLIYLGDREMAVVSSDGARFCDLDGRGLSKEPETIGWDPVSAVKGHYKHFMLKEIYDQPQAIIDTIGNRIVHGSPEIDLGDVGIDLKGINKVILVACGTAWHACLVGKFMIEYLARIPVEVDYASEFRYRDALLGPKTLLISVTQSGETADTLAAMDEAREKGAPVATICNVPNSMATRKADYTLYTYAGPEIGVASTKAFTAQLVALAIFAAYIGKVKGSLDDPTIVKWSMELDTLPRLAGELIGRADRECREIAWRYHKADDFLYLGRGINYPIALEGALKLKEISYVHAEGYPAGEMKHGPIALIDENMPVVAIAPRNQVYEKMLSNIEEVKAREGRVVALATDGDEKICGVADHVIYIPFTSYLLTPILAVIPLQLLAYHIAEIRGCDVDQPRNLAKSVTVE